MIFYEYMQTSLICLIYSQQTKTLATLASAHETIDIGHFLNWHHKGEKLRDNLPIQAHLSNFWTAGEHSPHLAQFKGSRVPVQPSPPQPGERKWRTIGRKSVSIMMPMIVRDRFWIKISYLSCLFHAIGFFSNGVTDKKSSWILTY
jgi:hypothetical protein